MLTTCPECSLQVSDKATICPHCGYPLQSSQKYPSNRKKPLKRRRLPNGFGQISEIKSQYLRKPFRAMVTVGKTDTGKPICKLLQPEAYFATYNEAYEALLKYHSGVYNTNSDITLSELYTLWSEERFGQLSSSRVASIKSFWSKCSQIENINVKDLKPAVISKFIDGIEDPVTAINIKGILNQMYDYAVNNEYCERNYARSVRTRSKQYTPQHHESFTDSEMHILWQNINEPIVKLILIQCYMGWRPQELLSIEPDDININEGWIKGGMKTESGFERIVPIHPCIVPYVNILYDLDLSYQTYRNHFTKTLESLNINGHTPHDCRKQFVTMAKRAGMDEYAIKRIVGHKISDITEAVYTDRDFEWLKYEMEKIKVYE